MRDMKEYLPQQLALHHIGQDEQQTENVHSMVKRLTFALLLCVQIVCRSSTSAVN